MSSTLTRFHWTNDTGTPAAPVGNGTVINDAQLQLIFDAVDNLFAGSINIGGVFSASGLGTHDFNANGVGSNIVRVKNGAAGTGNFEQFEVDNDAGVVGVLIGTSSTWTPAYPTTNSLSLSSSVSGGLNLYALNASAEIKLFTASSTLSRVKVSSLGTLLVYPEGTAPIVNHTFTMAQATVYCAFYDTDARADNHWIRFAANDGGSNSNTFTLEAVSDSLSTVNTIFKVTREGATPQKMEFGLPLYPIVDNTQSVGQAGQRFANGYFTTLVTGDAALENNFAFTEHYKVGLRTPGVALVNPDGDVVAFFDDLGRLHVREMVCDLDDLGWIQTTSEERARA